MAANALMFPFLLYLFWDYSSDHVPLTSEVSVVGHTQKSTGKKYGGHFEKIKNFLFMLTNCQQFCKYITGKRASNLRCFCYSCLWTARRRLANALCIWDCCRIFQISWCMHCHQGGALESYQEEFAAEGDAAAYIAL